MKPGAAVAMTLLALIAVIHVVRVLLKVPVIIGTTTVPMWASLVAAIVSGVVAIALWREAHSAG